MTKISKTKVLEVLKNSGGKFFTIVFLKSNGKERKMNCTWVKDQKDKGMGNYIVREVKLLKSEKEDEWIKSFNINKLQEVRINKQTYKVA